MSTWDLLVAGSTLPDDGINSAWLHINNLGGGGVTLLAIGEAAGGIENEVLSASVSGVLSGAITEEMLSASLVEETLEGSISTALAGSITEETLTGSISCN